MAGSGQAGRTSEGRGQSLLVAQTPVNAAEVAPCSAKLGAPEAGRQLDQAGIHADDQLNAPKECSPCIQFQGVQ